ncbi:MAG: SulP family inorganic anion transporter [Parcubacteria group bacterium]|jgi:SulP family sulfate permease
MSTGEIAGKIKKIQLGSFFPFIAETKNYNFSKFKADIIAGLTVAIVALPQAMAYAIIAGVNPKFGLYAAIFPAIVAALFGSSRFLAAGPTNAISMVVSSSMASAVIAGTLVSSLPEDQKIGLLFLLSFMVGAMQLLMGIFKFGNFINFVSHSVVVGFTAGAGILIAFNQLKNLIGVSIGNHPHFIDGMKHTFMKISDTNMYALGLGLFTIIFIVVAKKISKKIPGSLIAMIITAIMVFVFKLEALGVKSIGSIPQTLPPFSSLPLNMDSFHAMFPAAVAIAILGIVESLSIAKSIASRSGEKIDGNQEFIAQGLANMTAGITSGIPGAGSFTRSAVNYSSGAKTRFAVIFSGLFILTVILIAAPLARFIPITSLAGILMVIAYSMIDKHAFMMAFRATAADRIVLLVTMSATLFLELEQAVYIGVMLSILLFVRKVSVPQIFQVAPNKETHKLVPTENSASCCPQISIFQVEGSLFFGAIAELEDKLSTYIKNGGKIVIVRLAHVQLIDATGIHALESFLKECEEKNITLMFTNVRPAVMRVFNRSGMTERVGRENFFAHTQAAIEVAVKKVNQLEKCKGCAIHCFEECRK